MFNGIDLDHEERRIQEAPDVPPLSDIVLKLLGYVGFVDNVVAGLVQRVQDLEREVRRLGGNV